MNEIPGISLMDGINPTLSSPYSPFTLSFYQTRDTLADIELYQKFLSNGIKTFRKSAVYKNYKHFLMMWGIDKSQVHSNINSEMADLEMHHNVLTIYDIAIILVEHTLNNYAGLTSFDLFNMLREVHTKHLVQLVMLDLTTHQLFHNSNGEIYYHPRMCVGKWWEFIELYKDGITPDIARKIITYIDKAEKLDGTVDGQFSKLRDNIKDWSGFNGYSQSIKF